MSVRALTTKRRAPAKLRRHDGLKLTKTTTIRDRTILPTLLKRVKVAISLCNIHICFVLDLSSQTKLSVKAYKPINLAWKILLNSVYGAGRTHMHEHKDTVKYGFEWHRYMIVDNVLESVSRTISRTFLT